MQSELFRDRPWVEPTPADPALVELGRGLSPLVRFGTSSWSFPGWTGLVWARDTPADILARHGLGAYAAHPLLRAVGVDRSYWGPVDTPALREWADAVPAGFTFLSKAHEDLVWARFPDHDRYGRRRGAANARFLDPSYAADEGLGPKAGPIVFQVPPQGRLPRFADDLHAFLDALPRGPLYAVEIRDRDLLDEAYGDALVATGAVHCLTVHPGLPDLRAQWRLGRVAQARALVVRWNLHHDLVYEEARDTWAPFDRLQRPDPAHREQLAKAVAWMVERERPAVVIANNKAEGSAPQTVRLLAARVVALTG